MIQEKLIIYLRESDLEQPGWAVRDATGQVRQSAYKDSPDGLAQLAHQREVIVIVPAADVLMASARLPKMSRPKLLLAIPYTLEEQLVDDVEELHFSASDYHEDGSISIAVVSKSKMEQWLSTLRDWNITPNMMVSTVFAIPFAPSVWHVLIDDMAAIRSGASQGFGCEKTNLTTFLNLALSTSLPLPELIYIHNYSESLPLHLAVKTKEELLSTEQMLEEMARQVCIGQPINLLQGIYASRKKTRFKKLNNIWKAITYLFVLLLILLISYPTFSYIILKRQESELKNQIAKLYRKHFPEAKSIIAPKQRMEDKLHGLQGTIGDDRLLLLLGYVGKGLSQSSGISLKRFDFQSGQLTIQLSAANSVDFSVFNTFLMQQGLQVKQQNADLAGERVNATLVIE